MPSRAVFGRLLVLALFVSTSALLGAGPAAAHAALVSSTPKDGSSMATLPDTVDLEFDQNVGSPAYVVVTAPDGTKISTGDPVIRDNRVTQAVSAPDQSGTYTMAYRVVSSDGHPVAGEITFETTEGETVAAKPASRNQADQPDAVRRYVLPLGVMILVLVAVAALAWRRRREQD